MNVIGVVVHKQGPHALQLHWDSLATSVDPHRCFNLLMNLTLFSGACAGLL